MELQRDQDDRYVEPEPFNEGIENPVDVDERCVLLPLTGSSRPARDAGKLRDEQQCIWNSLNKLGDLVNSLKTNLIQEAEEEKLMMRQYRQKGIDQQTKVYEEMEKLKRFDDKLIILLHEIRDQIDHDHQLMREREKMINGREQDLIQREKDLIQREKDLIQREGNFNLPEGSYMPIL